MAASPGDDWNADFLDLVDALVAARVDFLVVGAFALAQHGLLRATADIDFVVRASPENAQRVVEALRAFGAPLASVESTMKKAKLKVITNERDYGAGPCRSDSLPARAGGIGAKGPNATWRSAEQRE